MVRYHLGLLVLAVEDEGWSRWGEGSREAGRRVINPRVPGSQTPVLSAGCACRWREGRRQRKGAVGGVSRFSLANFSLQPSLAHAVSGRQMQKQTCGQRDESRSALSSSEPLLHARDDTTRATDDHANKGDCHVSPGARENGPGKDGGPL